MTERSFILVDESLEQFYVAGAYGFRYEGASDFVLQELSV